MSYETITVEQRGRVALLTLNRPEKLNAYTGQMGAEITDAFQRADADDDILLVSRRGMSLRFAADDAALRPMGRSTSGVKGMSFRAGDRLLSADVLKADREEDLPRRRPHARNIGERDRHRHPPHLPVGHPGGKVGRLVEHIGARDHKEISAGDDGAVVAEPLRVDDRPDQPVQAPFIHRDAPPSPARSGTP